MLGRGIARFFELRGREIVEAAGSLWYSVPGRMFMSLPHQLTPDPDPAEIGAFLRRTGALGVRYPSLLRPGLPSGLYVCRNKAYDLSAVRHKLRSNVRRGLENCEIRRATEEELLAQGLQLNVETMARQGRHDNEFGDSRRWQRLVKAMAECPEIMAWGAFAGDRLAAYAITCREDGWLHILHRMSRRQDLELRPNHALDFTITRQVALDDSVDAVCFGMMGLVSGEGLHDYKLGMGHEAIPQSSVFELHPALAPVLTSAPVVGSLRRVRRLLPKNQLVERVTTVFEGARMSRLGTVAAVRLNRWS